MQNYNIYKYPIRDTFKITYFVDRVYSFSFSYRVFDEFKILKAMCLAEH